MIFSNYDQICEKIKIDLEDVSRVSIALNAWFNSQKIVYFKVSIYWVNASFQFQE